MSGGRTAEFVMTSAVTKVSSCVDCGTPIIGARPRCPVCHDQHAKRPSNDQEAGHSAIWQVVFAGFVVAQVVVVVAILLMFVGKGCS